MEITLYQILIGVAVLFVIGMCFMFAAPAADRRLCRHCSHGFHESRCAFCNCDNNNNNNAENFLAGGRSHCHSHFLHAAGANGERSFKFRWLGGGVLEIASPDYKQICIMDAVVWSANNDATWTNFNVTKPAEFTTPANYLAYINDKAPNEVLICLTHDHADHSTDFVELCNTLINGLSSDGLGVRVKIIGQSDLMRNSTNGFNAALTTAGVDPATAVANGGNGLNFGGAFAWGNMNVTMIQAIHSNLRGQPACGYMLDINGCRIYVAGDTDLYGDMKIIADRYRPNVAFVGIGGPFSMNPHDAAIATKWTGACQAFPYHYAHSTLAGPITLANDYLHTLSEVAPAVKAQSMVPGNVYTVDIIHKTVV